MANPSESEEAQPSIADEHALAVTERGTTLDEYTEAEVNLALRLLILKGGKVKEACQTLTAEGIQIDTDKLRYWRDVAFPSRFYGLRRELGQEVGEEIAGRAMERAMRADEAQGLFIDEAIKKVDDIQASHLPRAAADMAKVMATNVEKAQLLRNRPTQIKETRDTGELIEQLKRLGLVQDDPRVIEAEVVED